MSIFLIIVGVFKRHSANLSDKNAKNKPKTLIYQGFRLFRYSLAHATVSCGVDLVAGAFSARASANAFTGPIAPNPMFDVSVDQFIHADGGARSSSCRKHIDVLLNSMNEKELVVIEATAEGIKKARETEDA